MLSEGAQHVTSHTPLVSILIPCRNAADWLRTCVQSALAQTHEPIEVIVHDDGSTDGSLETLVGFNDPRLILQRGPGEGGNVARNHLLTAATGEWVQFLDADDYLEPDKISRQLAEASDLSTADVLYSPVWIETWRDDRPVHREASPLDSSADLLTQWFTWQLPQTGGALWRRETLLRLGGWKADQPCCQEHELYLRALHAGLRFRHCPAPGAVYRIWSEQTVCRTDPILVIREKTKLIDAAITWLTTTNQLTQAHRGAAAQACFEMARTWAKTDLAAATDYAADRRAADLFWPTGPAAPPSYRLAFNLLGFAPAERLAQWLR